jgi:hypothetical protein
MLIYACFIAVTSLSLRQYMAQQGQCMLAVAACHQAGTAIHAPIEGS